MSTLKEGDVGGGSNTFKSYFFFKFLFLPQELRHMSALGRQSQILLSTLGVNFDCFNWSTVDAVKSSEVGRYYVHRWEDIMFTEKEKED